MIYVGIDDTDVLGAPGTNHVARRLVADLGERHRLHLVVRLQLLVDPRVPYTSKNSAAALLFDGSSAKRLDDLIGTLRDGLIRESADGSDPGLCVTREVPAAVSEFGRRCQREVVTKAEAAALASAHDLLLEGLGGTDDGVIGALAAVGLASTGDDGRVVAIGGWPDDLSGPQPITTLTARGVVVRQFETNAPVTEGTIDLGKKLRPSCRRGEVVLFVNPADAAGIDWRAVRLD